MGRERIGLSAFEAFFHGKHKRVTLNSEVGDCFKYFNDHSPKALGDQPIVLIHGSKIELRKIKEGRGYSIEMDGVVRVIGIDYIPKQEQIEMVRRIRNITFPYAEHVKAKSKKS